MMLRKKCFICGNKLERNKKHAALQYTYEENGERKTGSKDICLECETIVDNMSAVFDDLEDEDGDEPV